MLILIDNIMKKFFVLMVLCLATSFVASAEPQKYYFMYMLDNTDNLLSGWFIVDREKMTYEPESDSEVLNQIKNYKKSGNVETFEVWEDSYFVHGVELVTEPDKTTVTFIYKGEQGEERSPTQIIGSEAEWEKAYEKKYGKKPAGGDDMGSEAVPSPQSGLENAKNKVTGGVKNAFNKTKDLFKKKDK